MPLVSVTVPNVLAPFYLMIVFVVQVQVHVSGLGEDSNYENVHYFGFFNTNIDYM